MVRLKKGQGKTNWNGGFTPSQLGPRPAPERLIVMTPSMSGDLLLLLMPKFVSTKGVHTSPMFGETICQLQELFWNKMVAIRAQHKFVSNINLHLWFFDFTSHSNFSKFPLKGHFPRLYYSHVETQVWQRLAAGKTSKESLRFIEDPPIFN